LAEDIYAKPGSQVIPVPETGEPIAKGVSQRPLFANEDISLRQLDIAGLHSLPAGNLNGDRYYVVLRGNVAVNGASENGEASGNAQYLLAEEALAYIPRQSDAAGRLQADGAGASMLEIEMRNPGAEPKLLKLEQGTWLDEQILVIRKEDAFAYIPAHHEKTYNHCLLINEDIEILLSCIEVGGGADVHTHHGENQCTYIMNPGPSKVLHYPMGVEHGGIVNIADRHDLVLIYFPPMGEYL